MSRFRNFTFLVSFFLASWVSGCAQLHHAQLGEIDTTHALEGDRFEVKISELGFSTQEASQVGQAFLNKKGQKYLEDLELLISLFQMGPKTGNPVFEKDYAKNLVRKIYTECPSGRVTNLLIVRETRKYPVISGEILKITGDCIQETQKGNQT